MISKYNIGTSEQKLTFSRIDYWVITCDLFKSGKFGAEKCFGIFDLKIRSSNSCPSSLWYIYDDIDDSFVANLFNEHCILNNEK